MKAKREQDDDKRLIIKLFANNYARDLIYDNNYHLPVGKTLLMLYIKQ
jgi:hypothetical protein